MESRVDRRPRREGRAPGARGRDGEDRPREQRDFTLDQRFQPEQFVFHFEPSPDKAVRDAQLAKPRTRIVELNKQLETVTAAIQAISDRITEAKSHTTSPEDQAVLDKLRECQAQQTQARERLRAAQAAQKQLSDQQREMRQHFRFSTGEALDAAIEERHYYYETHTMDREEEHRVLADIHQLEAQRADMDRLIQLNAEVDAAHAARDAAFQTLTAAQTAVNEAQQEVEAVRQRQKPGREAVDALIAERKERQAEKQRIFEELRAQKQLRDKIWNDFVQRCDDWKKRHDAAYATAREEYETRQRERREQWEAAVARRTAIQRDRQRENARRNKKLEQANALRGMATTVQQAARSKHSSALQHRGNSRVVDLSVDSEAPWLDMEVADFLRELEIAVPAEPSGAETLLEAMREKAAQLDAEGKEEVRQRLAQLEEQFREEDAHPKPTRQSKSRAAQEGEKEEGEDGEPKPERAKRQRRRHAEKDEIEEPVAVAAPAPEQAAAAAVTAEN